MKISDNKAPCYDTAHSQELASAVKCYKSAPEAGVPKSKPRQRVYSTLAEKQEPN